MGMKQTRQNFIVFEVMVIPYSNSLNNQHLIGQIKKEAGICSMYINSCVKKFIENANM